MLKRVAPLCAYGTGKKQTALRVAGLNTATERLSIWLFSPKSRILGFVSYWKKVKGVFPSVIEKAEEKWKADH